MGYDAGHGIDGVTLGNVKINGLPLAMSGVVTNAFVSGVRVDP